MGMTEFTLVILKVELFLYKMNKINKINKILESWMILHIVFFSFFFGPKGFNDIIKAEFTHVSSRHPHFKKMGESRKTLTIDALISLKRGCL